MTVDGSADQDEVVPTWDLPNIVACHSWEEPAAVWRAVNVIVDRHRDRRRRADLAEARGYEENEFHARVVGLEAENARLRALIGRLEADQRLARLEERVTGLEPVVARIAFYEEYQGVSVPEQLVQVREALEMAAAVFHVASGWEGREVRDVEPYLTGFLAEFRRPPGEPLPEAAVKLRTAYEDATGS